MSIAPTSARREAPPDGVGASRSLEEVLERWARASPDAPLLCSLDEPSLTYRGALDQLHRTREQLAALDLRPGDTVASMLRGGAQTTLATLIFCASGLRYAPWDPGLADDELAAELARLKPAALVVAPELLARASRAASADGVQVFPLSADAGARLSLRLGGPTSLGRREPRSSTGADGVALILRTSGSTGVPKGVPLTQANLIAAAWGVQQTTALTPADRYLNVLPHHHIGGVATVLGAVYSGGSIFSTPGFAVARWGEWLERSRATWTSHSPAMLRAVLERVRSGALEPSALRHPLRTVRCSSARLEEPLRDEFERVFRVRVANLWGMTETAGCVVSSPPPPAQAPRGAIGRAVGAELAIGDELGRLLPAGSTGEILVRGPTVMPSYLEPTPEAFTPEGWFRTGDLGFLDAAGFLHCSGRLKEQINCGGEKISPLEVDAALLQHPEVADAAAFGAFDQVIGEVVAAAVVRRPGSTLTAGQLREYAAQHLSRNKVPWRILFLEELPRASTGKPLRQALSGRLAASRAPDGAPRQPSPGAWSIEEALGRVWAGVLAIPAAEPDDDFFALGGNSMKALEISSRLAEAFGVEVPASAIFEFSTISRLGAHLRSELSQPGA